jgi:hypothetical protein
LRRHIPARERLGESFGILAGQTSMNPGQVRIKIKLLLVLKLQVGDSKVQWVNVQREGERWLQKGQRERGYDCRRGKQQGVAQHQVLN